MRTMDFGSARPSRQAKRAATLALAVLVHVLALVVVVNSGMMRFNAGAAQQGAPARFFVDVYLPKPAPHPAPVPAAAVTGAAATVAAPAPHIAPRSAVEVVILPRETPDTVHLPLPPSVAEAPAASPAEIAAASTDAGAASGQAGVKDDAPKVIAIETIGTRSATYSIPALSTQGPGARPQVFKVDIGNYSDIELAIIDHLIEQIRARYPDEITWESKARGGIIRVSMRREDHDALVKFLRAELFAKKKATPY